MSSKEDAALLYINHDIRNYIGAAISHAQLLTMQHPELENSPFTEAIVESLNEAKTLSEKASVLVQETQSSLNESKVEDGLETYLLDKRYFEGVDSSCGKPILWKSKFPTRFEKAIMQLDLI